MTGLLIAQAAAAEVKLATPDALVIEHRFAITAAPERAWEVLVHPERYWPKDHTWSLATERRTLIEWVESQLERPLASQHARSERAPP